MDINIQEIINRFEPEIIKGVDCDNMKKILEFLNKQNIECIEDIVMEYFDLFLIPYNDFINRFERFNNKCGDRLVMLIDEDLSILDEFLNI